MAQVAQVAQVADPAEAAEAAEAAHVKMQSSSSVAGPIRELEAASRCELGAASLQRTRTEQGAERITDFNLRQENLGKAPANCLG